MRVQLLGAIAILASNDVMAGPAHDALEKMNEASELQIMSALVRSAGERCRDGIGLSYLGQSGDTDFWTVRCSDAGKSADFVVSTKNSGSTPTKIMSCKIAEMVGTVCWKPFKG